MAAPATSPPVVFLTDIVTPYFVPTLKALSKRVRLTVLYCEYTGSRAMEWRLDDLPYRHSVIGGLMRPRGNPDGTDLYLAPKILRELIRAKPRVIISGGFSVPTLYAAIHGQLRGSRLLIYSDGTRESERTLTWTQRTGRRFLLPRATGSVAKSRRSLERFVELGMPRDRVFLAHHSTQLEPLWEVARRRRADTVAARPTVSVLSVGRLLMERKGLDSLLRAVRAAQDDYANLTLTIAGSGPDEARIRELAAHLGVRGLSLPGFVTQEALPALYASADIFAFPTRRDPYGLVALEAAAAGLPLIASPEAGATHDLVAEGRTGFVVAPDDIGAMARRLVQLAQDGAARGRMGQAAHELTLEQSPEHAADVYADAVEFACNANRSRIRVPDEAVTHRAR